MLEDSHLNHFRGYRGYALLDVFLSFGLALLALVVIGFLQRLGVTAIQSLSPFIILSVLFLAAHFSAGRFIEIEGRTPRIYDTNSIAIYSTFILAIFFLIVYALVVLIGGGMSSDFSKFFSTKSLGFFGAGSLGFILVFQVMLYLSFALFARFRQLA